MSESIRNKLLQSLLVCAFLSCRGQNPFGIEHLDLAKTINLPAVRGRLDHLAINLDKQVVYVAALGNRSVEVVDLNKGIVIHAITGLNEPQGVAYLRDINEIVVANGGDGTCIFYRDSDYSRVAVLNLGDDADNVRYDASTNRVYVGFGSGGIAVINALSHQVISKIELHAHPESFQLDEKNRRLFVNLPGSNSIAVIDIDRMVVIDTWKPDGLAANFPMAIDTTSGEILLGFRRPAMLVRFNEFTGKQVSSSKLVGDVDDIFYYDNKQLALASGGDGTVNIFRKIKGGDDSLIANIPTGPGARTSLLVPSLNLFIVALRANGGKPAALNVYRVSNN